MDFTTTAVEWKPGIGQIKQFNFVEKKNMYVKPKKSEPFCLTTAVPLHHGCWIRGMVVFVSDVVAKQCGAVKRSAITFQRICSLGNLR